MSNYFIDPPDYPYRFDLLLDVLRRFAHPARQIVRDEQLWRVTNGHIVCYQQHDNGIQIRSSGDNDAKSMLTTSHHILGIDEDHSQFYQYAKSDKKLWAVVEPLVGLPIFRTETIFEAMITLIIEQHISWKNALRAQQTLMEIFETEQTQSDVLVYDFPSVAQIAEAHPDDLKPLKITNRRVALIIQIAQDIVSGDLDLDTIQTMDTASAYQHLLKIKGVGHWTANNVLGRALGKFPYVSYNDVALQAAVLHYFHNDVGKKSAQQVTDTLEPFGEFAGLAGHFTLLRWVLDQYPVI